MSGNKILRTPQTIEPLFRSDQASRCNYLANPDRKGCIVKFKVLNVLRGD